MPEVIENSKGLSRFQLKLIAVVAMLIDHITYATLDFYTVPAQILHVTGRLTIPIMCFFIAEGIKHTSNLRAYIGRMIIGWMISIVPFYMFFGEMYGYRQNIILDLLFALLTTALISSDRIKKPLKILGTAGLFGVSAVIGGWPVLPILFVLIFYYIEDKKKRTIVMLCVNTGFVAMLMGLVALNQKLHFSEYDWAWYDRAYLFGFALALIPLWFYNGKSGCEGSNAKKLFGKYFFYAIYPLHLLILAVVFNDLSGIAKPMYLLCNIICLILMLAVVVRIACSKPSRPQNAIMVFMIFGALYCFCFCLEISSETRDAVLTAVKAEYFCQCAIIVSFTWFVSRFCKVKISKVIYTIEYIFGLIVMIAVGGVGKINIFYRSFDIDYSTAIPKLVIDYGPLFYVFQGVFFTVFMVGVIFCAFRMKKSTGIEFKRYRCIILGCCALYVELIMFITGLTGGYDFNCLGILAALLFFAFALLNYGYFDSVQAANENILSHGSEGILVVDSNGRISFCNEMIKRIFPEVNRNLKAENIPDVVQAIKDGKLTRQKGEKYYDIMADPLVEFGFVQGYAVRAIDMTDHYNNLELIRMRANTDPLTGLSNRMHFESCLTEYLKEHRRGAMIMFDLDNFKYVNDNFGHGTGDKVLIAFGDLVRSLKKDEDIICRIGGDEFCGFIADVTDKDILSGCSQDVIKGFAASLRENSLPEMPTVSIGIAVYDGSYDESFVSLYGNADKALYSSKNSGKNMYKFYEK